MKIKKKLTIEDFIEMENLELKYYSSEHVTPHEEAFKWHLDFPETGVVLEDQGRIIAFLDLLPIKDTVFQSIQSGLYNDKYLTTNEIVKLDDLIIGDNVNLLLSCIVVDDKYRKTDALKILLHTQLSFYQTYLNQGIRIEHIITSNVTKQGERFSEKMGFQRIGESEHGTVLYISTFENLFNKVLQL